MEFGKSNDLESLSPFKDSLSSLNPQLDSQGFFKTDEALLGSPGKWRSMSSSFDGSLNQYTTGLTPDEQVLNLQLPSGKDSFITAGDPLTGVVGTNPLVGNQGDKLLWGGSNDTNSSIVFIDSSVEDYQSLIAGIKPGTEVAILDSVRNQVEQIGEYLAGRSGISSIHIVSHGDSGSLQLGGTKLGRDTLNNNSSALQSWSKSLTADADILLYGCDVAAGEQGAAFVKQLSLLTGADVAASSDRTGNAALGGDWNLEFTTGSVEAGLAFQSSVMQSYNGVLSHFYSGTLNWEPVPDQSNTIEINGLQTWRLDAFGNPSIGSVVSDGTTLQFGDGSTTQIAMRVVEVNSANNYFQAEIGTGSTPQDFQLGFTHTYASVGNYTAFYDSAARVGFTKNNANANFRLETLVNVGTGNTPPISQFPAVLQVVDNSIETIQIAAFDPTGDTLRYRLATPSEAGSGTTQPPSLSINSTTGELTFDVRDSVLTTAPRDYWSTQVVVEDTDTLGNVKSKISLDLLLLIVEPQVNDAPVNTVAGDQTTNEDTSLVFSLDNLIAISDPDAGINPVQITLTANNGILTLNGTQGLTFGSGDGTADPTMTITASLGNINRALDGMSFTPTANFSGSANVQIITNDQGNLGSGGPLSDTDTVNITVNPVNDVPTVANLIADQTATEDSLYSFQVDANNFNDVDTADTLTYTATLADETALPSWLTFDAATRTFSGTPLNGDVGTLNVNVIATDSANTTATDSFTLSVNNTNDAPIANSEALSTLRTQPIIISRAELLANDTDIDRGDILSINGFTQPSNGTLVDNGNGTLTYTPNTHFGGTDSFSYTVDDAQGGTANSLVNLTVNTEDGIFNQVQLRQFLNTGDITNRDLNSLNFDEGFYLERNPDVAQAVALGAFRSGFEHFLSFGQAEGRDPSVLFDENYYLTNNQDVDDAVKAGAFRSGYDHFLSFGIFEGRNPSRLFDNSRYLTENQDVALAVEDGAFRSGFEHFLSFGQFEGRQPKLELFDEDFYLDNNQDVATAVANGGFSSGFEHFILFGQAEGRIPSDLFDAGFYLSNNPDVAQAVLRGEFRSGFEHFILFGRAEGRSAVS